MISILEDISNIKSDRKKLREFGLTMGAVFLVFFGLALMRGRTSCRYFLVIGLLCICLGVIRPGLLKPFQRAWMMFAVVIGFFMSRVILIFLFYGVLTPTGLLAKLFCKDVLDERISRDRVSYWTERPTVAKAKKSYENQF